MTWFRLKLMLLKKRQTLTTLMLKRLTAVITSLLWNCPVSVIYTYNTATCHGKACLVWLTFH